MRTLSLLLLLLCGASAAAADLVGSVDRNRISINETLTFTLEYDDKASTDSLDLEPLKQDFEVLGVRPQSSSSVAIVNGNYSEQTRTSWILTLAPRRQGTLVIPSFNVDGNVSDAIRIEVSDASSARPQDTPMLVELDTDISRAYVGQQILVNIELRAQDNVGNLSGQQLQLDNVHLELLDQRSFRRLEQGISWQVIEWQYAIIPEQSGTLRIPPQLFSGVVSSPGTYGLPDPFNSRGRRISARSNAMEIEVLPPPDTAGRPWFPASNVSIRANWSGDTDKLRVGEPMTRTVEIIAEGQRASAIPPLAEEESLTYKAYRDQPQLEDKLTDRGILGMRRESTAIVPSAEGELRLPEERIHWWNTHSEQWEEAVLPEQRLQVLPARADTSFAPPDAPVTRQPEESSAAAPTAPAATPWYWPLSTLVLALIVILQCWLLWRRRKTPANSAPQGPNNSEARAWKTLQRALRAENCARVRAAVLAWAQQCMPGKSITTLEALAAEANDAELTEQLRRLDAALYRGDSTPEFSQMGAALERLRTALKRPAETGARLQPLYPN